MSHLIITGHSRGLGCGVAEQFLQRGYQVLGLSRHANPELARPRADRPGRLCEVRLDLADTPRLLDWLQSSALADFLAPASAVCLINNAGVLQPVGPLGTQDGAALARSVAINVTAPLLLANAVAAAAPAGIERRLLHISSGVGRRPCAGWSVYSATKAALDQHARSATRDALPGLRIASLAPGVVDTDMQAEIRASDPALFPLLPDFQALKAKGQLSSPAACAEKLVNYLLSDDFARETVVDLREMA